MAQTIKPVKFTVISWEHHINKKNYFKKWLGRNEATDIDIDLSFWCVLHLRAIISGAAFTAEFRPDSNPPAATMNLAERGYRSEPERGMEKPLENVSGRMGNGNIKHEKQIPKLAFS